MSTVDITPESAGWTYCGLRVIDLSPGESYELVTGRQETVVLPLSGGCTVGQFALSGRTNVFAGPTDFAYVPMESTVTIHTIGGGRFALPSARATRKLPIRYGSVEGVSIELRGAGQSSRQVHNFCTPETFDAEKLIAVEVITPGGNWSSYPPHKHDEHTDRERPLEEIYYFEIDRDGFGYQRVYGSGIDILREVRTGDTVLIPHGYHGPAMAPPGYHMYYLNVMAGPDAERAWLCTDDPAHAWIRDTWAGEPIDPRLPFGGVAP